MTRLVAASIGLRRDGASTLHFDGLAWSLNGADPARSVRAGRAAVALDLQSLLLVRLTEPGRARRWIWLDQSTVPERWRDLRRALYARAPAAEPAGEPWRATAPADAP